MYHVLDGDIFDIIYHIWSDQYMTKRYENRDLYLVDTKTERSIGHNVGNEVIKLLNDYVETIAHLEKEIGAMKNDLTIVHRKNKELFIENLTLKKQLDSIPPKIREVWL